MPDFVKRIACLCAALAESARAKRRAMLEAACCWYPAQRKRLLHYGNAIVATALATMVRYWLDPFLEDSLPFTTYYPAVMFVAWYAGWAPALLPMVSGGLLAAYLFTEPRGSILIYNLEHQVGIVLYCVVGIVVIILTESLRRGRRRAEATSARLADIVRELDKEVAERKQTEQWLLESEQRFRGYFEQGLVGMAMLSEQGDWMEVNQRFCQLLGYREDELAKKTWSELTHPDDLPVENAHFRRMLGGVVNGYRMDKRFTRKDGEILYASLSVQFMRKDDGTPDCILVLAQDITDRKRLETDLRSAKDSADRAKATAELANRAKDYFLAILSHELRTPLAPVLMGVSLLQRRPDLNQEMHETLEMVRRNVEMEARLIDDLLDLARITQGKIKLHKECVDLATVIDHAVEVCRPDIEARGLEFGVDLGPNSPYWVEADSARLQQVFWNLLKNAIKFTPQGGCVGIRCRLDVQGRVVTEVNDSGIGITPDALPRLFNAFEQAERSISQQFGGLGLGLAISKAMTEMHGGRIEAHSKGRGKGATFSVTLPLIAITGQPPAGTPATLQNRAVGSLRVLLVEDHGVTAKMLRLVLASEGHEVDTAGDIAAALKLAAEHHFDLLISDLGLPDGSGHDLMRELRSRGYKFPGIAISGYGQDEDIQRSREAGFADHLTKPTPRERLIESIASVTLSGNSQVTATL
ncbi:MAG: ATP-binding protein [Candidatus Binataceae bacterium]